MNELKLHRLGIIMEPEPGNAMETEGILNPAAARGPDGELYLFPRYHHECIWISYSDLNKTGYTYDQLPKFESNSPLALPVKPWERLKIGAGTPPVLTKHGWLILYHGVSEINSPINGSPQLSYAAGLMILDKDQPEKILYRSPSPVLSPELLYEQVGTIANVVFPTGIDQRLDIGKPDRFDVYYGMADNRIGVARLDLPDVLPVTSFHDEDHLGSLLH